MRNDGTTPPSVSQEHFGLLIEAVLDCAIFLLDPTGHVTTWNAGAERILGYAADEIIGRHFSSFSPEDPARDATCAGALAAAERDGHVEDEGWRIRKDGTRFCASVALTALRDRAGTLLGFGDITRDLTERRQAEHDRIRLAETEEANRVTTAFLERERQARRAEEEARLSLETTLQSIGDAVIATDTRGIVTMMNPVAATLTGWTADEARGMPLRKVFPIVNEQTRKEVESPVERALRDGMVVGLANHTVLLGREPGHETPIDDSGAPIRDADGNVRGVVLVFRNVSAEKRAEARRALLGEASELLASSLDHRTILAQLARLAVPRLADWCSVEIVDEARRSIEQVAVAHVDPAKVAYARELGRRYPPDPNAPHGSPEVMRTGRSLFLPTIPEAFLEVAAKDDEQRRLIRELRLRSVIVVPLSTRTRILGALTLIFAESGRTYTEDDLAFAEDFAARATIALENARMYAAEQRAREAADAANRSKDEFLAAVSHELRTPLNAILGWSRMLNSSALDQARHDRAVQTIERNAVAMTQLIEDLLDISRITSGKMRLEAVSVDLSVVVEAAIDAVRPAAEAKELRIERHVDGPVPPVYGDPTRLQQIVWNLLSNAVKFTPNGGKVDVSLAPVGTLVELRVTDSGQGIEPTFLPFVFEPFRQADAGIARAHGGLGLGLTITRHLVELHGGTITAESAGHAKGATFAVRLPKRVLRASAPVPADAGATNGVGHAFEPATKLAGVDVLVVDDDEDARVLVGAILEACGAHVVGVSNAADALDRLKRDRPDVLLSDIGMPGENGYDLIRKVRALRPDEGAHTPAAAVTAYVRGEDRRKALDAGFLLHLSKPVDPDDLVTVVATLARLGAQRA